MTSANQTSPEQSEAWRLFQAGDLDAAATLCRESLTNPAGTELQGLLGLIHAQRGEHELAEQALRKAAALRPDDPALAHNRAEVLRQSGRIGEAARAFKELLARFPEFLPSYESLLPLLQAEVERLRAAGLPDALRQAQAELASLWNHRGNALLSADDGVGAEASYRQALAIDPQYASAWSNLCNVLCLGGRAFESEEAGRRALALSPQLPQAWNNLGIALSDQGRLSEADDCFARALALKPDFSEVFHNAGSGQLFNTLLSPSFGGADILQRHRAWGQRHPVPVDAQHPWRAPGAWPNRRRRIGVMSSDLRTHAMQHFLDPLLQHHDRTEFEIVCYAHVPCPDALTRRFMAHGHRWNWIHALSDDQLAAQLRADELDLLVECNGHTRGTRLRAMAHKPAYRQASWLGYLGTTGLPTMDYRLTDEWVDPLGLTEAQHTETLVRIPGGLCAYRPHEQYPPVQAPPCLREGDVTFGSLNSLMKLNPQVVELWSTLLKAVPGARLLLQAKQLADWGTLGRVRGMFEMCGVSADRLILRGASSDFLHSYQGIDIALDTFPYGGGATTCDALWMGVPVITCPADRSAGRLTNSILHQIGCAQWIARDPAHYVELAAALATDVPELARVRRALRDMMERSPLCDGPGFAQRWQSVITTLC
ncbi:MAG: tetratricopeptide repeat protein [Betaproteobacteria bacterium]